MKLFFLQIRSIKNRKTHTFSVIHGNLPQIFTQISSLQVQFWVQNNFSRKISLNYERTGNVIAVFQIFLVNKAIEKRYGPNRFCRISTKLVGIPDFPSLLDLENLAKYVS